MNKEKVDVNLLERSSNIIERIYTACKTCYSEKDPYDLYCYSRYIPEDDMLNLIDKVITAGHTSVLEHINFTFAISGISRTCSHQLVRFRHASYSQKSQRYVAYHTPFGYIMPDSITKNPEYSEKFSLLMIQIQNLYDEMLENEIPAEDARYIFPNACETSLVITFNLRELIHMCHLRLCTKAQWEIRELYKKIVDIVLLNNPWLESYLVPKCLFYGFCNEITSCGRVQK